MVLQTEPREPYPSKPKKKKKQDAFDCVNMLRRMDIDYFDRLQFCGCQFLDDVVL